MWMQENTVKMCLICMGGSKPGGFWGSVFGDCLVGDHALDNGVRCVILIKRASINV